MIYISEFEWSLLILSPWVPDNIINAPGKAVRFVIPGENPLHLTWMQTTRLLESQVVEAFELATMLSGALGLDEALSVLQRIWPPAGILLSAGVVDMPDGKKAIETTEKIVAAQGGQEQFAYQLLLPVKNNSVGNFQRLYFYAPTAEFDTQIEQVRQMSRSLSSIPARVS